MRLRAASTVLHDAALVAVGTETVVGAAKCVTGGTRRALKMGHLTPRSLCLTEQISV